MRHRKQKGRLSRRTSWRKATLKCLANDLFTYQRIETTQAKAKALRGFAEPLITLAKNNPDSINARRQAFQKLCDKTVVKCLFDVVAPLYKGVPGGYTRIILAGNRKGDGAQKAIIELTKRTISDEDLLGEGVVKETKKKTKSKKETAVKKTDVETKKGHSAPEVEAGEKDKKTILDVKKEKSKKEQQKVEKKGIFKRFRRKSI